jgi:microcystin-dependent protein
MTNKYARPAGAYAGQAGLDNATKYQDDAAATPKRPIASAKVDGDFNYMIEVLNGIDAASGSRASIAERLGVSLNADGTLKVSVASALDEFVSLTGASGFERVDNSTVRLVGGDFTGLFPLNRRVQVTVNGVALVGDVASVGLSGGNTLVEVVDLTEPDGTLGVIGSAPTAVGYGPLVPGAGGNVPRRTDKVVVSGFVFADDAGDLGITAPGGSEPAAHITAGGVTGLAAASVGLAALANDVTGVLVPTGMVVPFAGSSTPAGWLMCYGQAVSRATYSALFANVGTTYGSGDGSSTFNLPDLRGRSVFGKDDMGGSAANRVTSGNSGIAGATLGAAGGDERMHQHDHTVTDGGHSHAMDMYTGQNAFTSTGAYFTDRVGGQIGTGSASGAKGTATGGINSATTGIGVDDAGAGASQNMPPALVLNWVIKV